MRTLKEMVSNGQTAKFVRFKHEKLWYVTECSFEFPVSPEDISGEAELHSVEKAMSLMKWIRKHIDFINDSKDKDDNSSQVQTLDEMLNKFDKNRHGGEVLL